jgi:hypothetical protein
MVRRGRLELMRAKIVRVLGPCVYSHVIYPYSFEVVAVLVSQEKKLCAYA